MAEYQITCIDKPHSQSTHEEITYIGNLQDKWLLTIDGAIYQIEKKVSRFYMMKGMTKKRFYLEVVRVLGKRPYLRTHVDGQWTDDLLALEEFDEDCKVIS